MKKCILGILAAPSVLATILAITLFVRYVYTVAYPSAVSGIFFSGKQVSLLTDMAKALIPTVTGFAVLAGSGIGFLHKHQYLQRFAARAGVLGIVVALVISLACWTIVLLTMVDCARPFERITDGALTGAIDSQALPYLSLAWITAVVAAQVGIIAFFVAVNITVLVGAVILESAPEAAAGGEEGVKP